MSTDWPGGFYTYEDHEQSAVVGSYDVALYPEGPARTFHLLQLPHLRHTGHGSGPAQRAVELLHFLTSRESQAFEARLRGRLPSAKRLSRRRPRRGRSGLAGRAQVGITRSGGARSGPDPP